MSSASLQVWANADYPSDARRALDYGAQGIGLCRTEHMFFEAERLPTVQKMILADSEESSPGRARHPAALPEGRLHRSVPGYDRPAGYHPPH
jgi:phosphoenolpyruvate synthase/pyruvate phosphate dikinase